MSQICIDTDHAREIGQRLVAEGGRLTEVDHELRNAIASLDTGAGMDVAAQRRSEELKFPLMQRQHTADEHRKRVCIEGGQ